jgi:hypothetical protein
MAEATPAPTECSSSSSPKEVASLLKFAIRRFKYSADTYLVCLTMLNRLKFEIPQGKVRLMASALLLIAAKVHEFRTPKFFELLEWS